MSCASLPRRLAFQCVALALVASGCGGPGAGVRVVPHTDAPQWQSALRPGGSGGTGVALLYAVSPPLGYARARSRPLEGFVVHVKLRWNAAVQPLSGLFAELAGQPDTPRLTHSHDLLQGAVQRIAGRKTQLDAVLQAHGRADTQAPTGQVARRAEEIIGDAARMVEALRRDVAPPGSEGRGTGAALAAAER